MVEYNKGIPKDRMAVLFAVMLVAAAGNTAMQSILPALGAKLKIPDVWVSLAFSWSALLWVFTAPGWARMSDKRGRKVLMSLGIIGFISSMALCGFILWLGLSGWLAGGLTFILFAAARSLYGGLGSAAPPAVQAYVAARTAPEERTQALSLVSSSFGLGTVIGPAIAPFLILPIFGLAGPMISFAVFGLIVLICIRWRLPNDMPRFAARGAVAPYPLSGGSPEPTQDEEETAETLEGPSADTSQQSGALRWTDSHIKPWFMAGFLGGQAQAMVLGIIGFLILDRLHLRTNPDEGAAMTGVVLMAGAFATLLAQWGIIPLLNMSARSAVLVGSGLAAAGVIGVAFANDMHSIAITFALASLGFGLYRPGFTAGASLAVPRRHQGAVAGMTASINGSAYIISPAIGVMLYNWHDGVAFSLMALILVILIIWGWSALKLPEMQS
ncbi:MAG TPA: MFS transporter [Sphingopyxis sp.]|nr:MFS transporter [Sphingopyxis sp.]